jgi:hypothetical protein
MINDRVLIDSKGIDWIGFNLARLQKGGLDHKQDDKTSETQAEKKSELPHETSPGQINKVFVFIVLAIDLFPNFSSYTI